MGRPQDEPQHRRTSKVRPTDLRTFALLAVASALNPELAVDADMAAAILRTTPGNIRRLRKREILPGKPATGRTGYVFPLATVLALKPHLRPKRRRLRPEAPGGVITTDPDPPPSGGKEGVSP